MRALILLALLLAGAAACSGSADVSVGRNDPVASDNGRSTGTSSAPWAGPTAVCDESTSTCRIGSCTLTIGCIIQDVRLSTSDCLKPPDTCSDEVAPVCGCDDRWYTNACEAVRATGGVLALNRCE